MMDAAIYYEIQAENLGFKFLKDLDIAVKNIVEFPETWPVIEGNIRRHLFSHFPYAVLYRIKTPEIRVVAVMTLHRKPGHWKNRV